MKSSKLLYQYYGNIIDWFDDLLTLIKPEEIHFCKP